MTAGRQPRLLLVAVGTLWMGVAGCAPPAAEGPAAASRPAEVDASADAAQPSPVEAPPSDSPPADPPEGGGDLVDEPLAAFRKELLDLAFETAAAIPLNPHIKDRAKQQQAVVDVCLRLDQPARALEYLKRIPNWRRGACYADLAFYCARNGAPESVQGFLDEAAEIAEDPDQDWRRDRVRIKIARTHAWLGQHNQAAEFEAGAVDSEAGKVASVRAMRADEETFEKQIKELEAADASGTFDALNHSLEACAQLFNRFYDDPQRRALAEKKLRAGCSKLPVLFRLRLLMRLADFALDHEDPAEALALVNEGQALVDGHRWRLEHRIPLMGQLAALRFRAGERRRARADADAALALFEDQGAKIVTIYRAEALLPLAEAYHAMGEEASALKVYGMAVEEGVVNPNSRPRAEDLSGVCRSMALHGVEPDADLWARMREIHERLGSPW